MIFCKCALLDYNTKKRGYGHYALYPRFCISILHHHRLFTAVCEGKHKPSVVVNGDALNGGAKSAVLPFGIEKVKLAKLKEESAKLIRLELLIRSLPCESRITLL